MKTFKKIHSGIFLVATFVAIYFPTIENMKLIYHGEANLLSLINFVILGIFSIVLVWIYTSKFSVKKTQEGFTNKLETRVFKIGIYIAFILIGILFSYLILKPINLNFSPIIKIWFGICFSIIGSLILDQINSNYSPFYKPIFSLLSFTLIVFLLSKIFNINNYPLALGWSETIDYSYGYSFYSWIIGKKEILLPFNNLSRYLLLAFPWFFNKEDIFIHRLWETSLIIITPLLTSGLLVKKLKFNKPYNFLFFVWGSLFLLQGPIYYNLLLIPILIFSLYNHNSIYKNLIIFLISIWAGFSRINWLPMPAAIGIIMYLCETMYIAENKNQRIIKNILVTGFFGLFGGILGYSLVSIISNQSPLLLNAAYSSLLLWYRLLPSSAYGIGILLWIIIISIPTFILLFYKNSNISKRNLKIKYIYIVLILAMFFLGGLIVSVKIGGGADIHNLDGYILLLFIIILYELKNRINFSVLHFEKTKYFSAALTFLFFIPSVAVLNRTNNVVFPNNDAAYKTIKEIQGIIDSNNFYNKEVLLGDEQHLILFGKLSGIEYNSLFDKNLILEAAMSQNIKYINKNNLKPLSEHKYDVLIMEPQQWNIKDPKSNIFAEENNLYIRIFSKEFREFYYLYSKINNDKLEIYYPIIDGDKD